MYRRGESADITAPDKTLTFSGYISERKNQAYLLDMLSYLPKEYKLDLIGKPLNPEDGKRLQDYCQDIGLDERVSFVGQIPHEDIPAYLQRAHVFVSASKMEVQSLAIIEALASGTPVVGLSNETIAELVDEGVGACLPADTPAETFAHQVRHICSLEASEYERLCQEARERVSHLEWSRVIARTVNAYEELLREKRLNTEVAEPEGATFDDLISFLATGGVREILKARQSRLVHGVGPTIWDQLVLGKKIKALQRVPKSTWMLAGLTVVVSVIGYVFMRLKSMNRSGQ